MKIDKQNGDICFNEEKHIYFNVKDPKKEFVSVTTLIHKFEPEFDKEFWSAYKALECVMHPDHWKVLKKELLNKKSFDKSILKGWEVDENDFNAAQQNILDNWQKENLASTERGSGIHSKLENSFYKQKSDIALSKYGIGGKFSCNKGATDLNVEEGLFPEYLIHYSSEDGKLNLAGQIDLFIKDGDSFVILDWKGLPLDTKIPTPSGFTLMRDLQVGDEVFDRNGHVCKVKHKSEVHYNPCYEFIFEDCNLVADEDHRWVVNEFRNRSVIRDKILTTKQIYENIMNYGYSYTLPTASPINGEHYKIKESLFDIENERFFIRLQYHLRSSFYIRYRFFEALSRKYVSFCKREGVFELDMSEFALWQIALIQELFNSLGIVMIFNKFKSCLLDELFPEVSSFMDFIDTNDRKVLGVRKTAVTPTQCIEVDSCTHTYLCTENFIVTHNTNKEIKKTSYFDPKTKRSEKMKYPLNTLDSCNFSTYNMQLSTYAWMIQQLHPDWKCKDLVLVHFDHKDNMTVYHMEYLKDKVEKMLKFWKKESTLEENRRNRQKIEY